MPLVQLSLMIWGIVWTAKACKQGSVFSIFTNIDCYRVYGRSD